MFLWRQPTSIIIIMSDDTKIHFSKGNNMNKKLILLMGLLSIISVVAMEDIKEIPVLQEASHNAEESRVKIRLTDSQYLETTHEVAIPVSLAKLIGALNKDLVEEPALKDSAFPLPNVTIVQWQIIEPLLEHVYRISQDASQAVQFREALMTEFRKLDVKSLIGVIYASDYLEIPILLESACDVVKRVALGKILWEELEVLPRDIRNQIIMHSVLMLLGPVPARELALCRGHEDDVYSVCVTEESKIFSGSRDKTARVWDMQGNQFAVCRRDENPFTSFCVTKDGKIVSGSYDNTVRVWDMEGKELAVCNDHQEPVWSVCVTQDGKIVSASWDNTVRVWDMEGNQLALCRGHESGVYSVCITKDNKIVSGSSDRTMRVWDMEGNQLAVCRGHEGLVTSICATRDGKIVSGSEDKMVRVWDMEGNQLAICQGHQDWVKSVCVTKEGKIVSGSFDKTVRVWDMKGNQLVECRGHENLVTSVCVTKDSKIVSGSHDYTVRVWDIGLLDSIVRMDEDQARAVWAYVRRLPYYLNKQSCWREIEKILWEDASLALANINNNNNE